MSATSCALDRSTTASASAEKSRPNNLTVSRYADLAGSPSAPSEKLSRKLASASLTPRPITPSDGVVAIVRWSISTRLCRRSSSRWSTAAISASRACSHSRHHLSNSTSSFVVRCDFLGIEHPSTRTHRPGPHHAGTATPICHRLKESLLTYYNETKNIAEGFAGRQMSKRVGVRTPVRRRCPCAPQKPAAAADFIAHRARPEMTGILPISIRSQCLQRSGHRAQVGRAGVRLAPGC